MLVVYGTALGAVFFLLACAGALLANDRPLAALLAGLTGVCLVGGSMAAAVVWRRLGPLHRSRPAGAIEAVQTRPGARALVAALGAGCLALLLWLLFVLPTR